MHNVILIGFMGCGKTSVGIRLSNRLQWKLEDTDKLIERKYRCSIAEIFASQGEAAFRQMETDCLHELLASKKQSVLSVGGGLAIHPQNQPLLRQLGSVIHLKATPETVYERLKNDTTRPLLQTEHPKQRIQELMEKRLPVYERLADRTIEVDAKAVEEIVEEILQNPGFGCPINEKNTVNSRAAAETEE